MVSRNVLETSNIFHMSIRNDQEIPSGDPFSDAVSRFVLQKFHRCSTLQSNISTMDLFISGRIGKLRDVCCFLSNDQFVVNGREDTLNGMKL